MGCCVIATIEQALAHHVDTLASSPVTLAHLSRYALPGFFHGLGFTRGAEIGVWKGGFSAALCAANPELELLCVDSWRPYETYQDTKRGFDEAYEDARDRLAPYRCTLDRRLSLEAVADVPDASLDFVYIDANHSKQAVLDDLAAWSAKVRRGGIVSGHDYRISEAKPFIEVVAAVDQFTRERGISPWFVLSADRTPSFLWVVT